MTAADHANTVVSYEFDSEGRAYSRHANGEVLPTGYTARSFAGKSDVTPERFNEIRGVTAADHANAALDDAIRDALDVLTGFSRPMNMAERISFATRILNAALSAREDTQVTAADHANTVREALRWTDLPVGLEMKAHAALDALAAHAEAVAESPNFSAMTEAANWERRAEDAEADNTRLREALERIAVLTPFNTPDNSASVLQGPAIARAALATDRTEAQP